MDTVASLRERADRSAAPPPSPFGPDDELGMLNHVTPATRARALAGVREGRLYDLGRVLDEHVPVFPGRAFHQTLVTTAHHVNATGSAPGGLGDNRVNWVTEVYSGTTQLGTHLDALSHLQEGDRCYNGVRVADVARPWGVTRLGVEGVPQIVTTGWLVDVAARRGVDRLQAGAVIDLADVAGLAPAPGDAVLFHTGWGALWDDAPAYLAGQPGPGLGLAEWLAARGVALTGCDTWSYGPVPPEESGPAVRGAPAPQRAPRRVRGREPRHLGPGRRRRAALRAGADARPHPRRHRRLDVTDRARLRV